MASASRATYAELLEGGVELFEYGDALLHAKTAVVDGIWSAVGSCNLDPRSFAHDNEANVAVVGREFGRSMEPCSSVICNARRPSMRRRGRSDPCRAG